MQNNTFLEHFSGQSFIEIDEVPSTNDYLKNLASNFKPLKEFTAIMAKNQTAGRGQRDNAFFSKPEESLTFSLMLCPNKLTLRDGFLINIVVSLGLQDWLKKISDNSFIKWPNDIILHNKKLGGVLIENTIAGQNIKRSIVGIGMNVFQQEFPTEINQKATSLLLEIPKTKEYTIRQICLEIIDCIRFRYEKANTSKKSYLAEYNNSLFKKNTPTTFHINGNTRTGIISHVDEKGLLFVEIDGILNHYYLQEISLVL